MRPYAEICWLMCKVREWLGHCCHDEDKQVPRFNIHEFIWQQCRKQWMQQCFLGANTKSPSENEQTLFTSSFTDGAMVLVMLVSYSVGHFIGDNPLTVSKGTHWLNALRDLNRNLVDLKLLCTFQQNNDPKHKDKTRQERPKVLEPRTERRLSFLLYSQSFSFSSPKSEIQQQNYADIKWTNHQ